ncbi:MAG: lipopolysaccharide heptosyltransferase I, partial [Limnobacter sp.]|nr:lipopolysaccharide heptosyltransferase I [Limnobacter sp.]
RELAQRLCAKGCVVQLPWGSPAEHEQAQRIAVHMAGVEVLPHMQLGELAERMGQVDLVVGVDTGLTHLAAAHCLPLVALFFATPAWCYAPRFNPAAISVGDVGHVPSVNEVCEAVDRFLQGSQV